MEAWGQAWTKAGDQSAFLITHKNGSEMLPTRSQGGCKTLPSCFQVASKAIPRRLTHVQLAFISRLASCTPKNNVGGAKQQLNTGLETLSRRSRCGCKTIPSYFQVASKAIPRRLTHVQLAFISRLASCTPKNQVSSRPNPKMNKSFRGTPT